MKIEEMYALVDLREKKVIDKIQKLPVNWRNISGLNQFSDEEVKNLKWAGIPGIGWLKLSSPFSERYLCDPENLILNKKTLRDLVLSEKNKKEEKGIPFKDTHIEANKANRFDLFIKSFKAHSSKGQTFVLKVNEKYYTLESDEVISLSQEMEDFFEECSKWEMNLFAQIESCKTLTDFAQIEL